MRAGVRTRYRRAGEGGALFTAGPDAWTFRIDGTVRAPTVAGAGGGGGGGGSSLLPACAALFEVDRLVEWLPMCREAEVLASESERTLAAARAAVAETRASRGVYPGKPARNAKEPKGKAKARAGRPTRR